MIHSPVLPRPCAEPPAELRFVVPGEPVPEQTKAVVRTVVNGATVHVGSAKKGRERPRAYRDLVGLHALLAIQRAGWRHREGDRYSVTVRAFVGNARVVDGPDNLFKPLLDGLKVRVFPDDSGQYVPEAHFFLEIDREKPRVEIIVRRLP